MMKYAITNPDGTMSFDVSFEDFETARLEGKIVWTSEDGIVYHMYV
jgi:hypothetical protein